MSLARPIRVGLSVLAVPLVAASLALAMPALKAPRPSPRSPSPQARSEELDDGMAGHRRAVAGGTSGPRRNPGSSSAADTAVRGAPPPRGKPIPQDVDSEERDISALLDPVTSLDTGAQAHGTTSGEIAVLVQEDLHVDSFYSSDEGVSFGPAVVAAGGSGELQVRGFDSLLAPDGTLYLATIAIDPLGDTGVQIYHSLDLGRTWSSPVDIARAGDDSHGDYDIALAANGNGVVAVTYIDRWGEDIYVRVSTDGGQSFAPRAYLNDGFSYLGFHSILGFDVAVDPDGVVHAAFGTAQAGSSSDVYYCYSTDGGVNFSAAASVTGNARGQAYPSLAATSSGANLLLAYWDPYQQDKIRVVERHPDVTFSEVGYFLVDDNLEADTPAYPRFAASLNHDTVMVGVIDASGALIANSYVRDPDWRWQSRFTFSASVHGFSMAHITGGTWIVAWSDLRNDTYIGAKTDLYAKTSTDDAVSFGDEARIDGDAPGAARTWLGFRGATGTDAGSVYVAYVDWRETHLDSDLYGARSEVSPLDFSGHEQRLDEDGGFRDPTCSYADAIATDKNDHVYAAFVSEAEGPYGDVYVAVSEDGGETFSRIERVSTHPAGTRWTGAPQVAATTDGMVYVVYQIYEESTPGAGDWNRELRLNISSDRGQTWLSQAHAFGRGVWGAEHYDIAAADGGLVAVSWSESYDIYIERSLDGGASFTSDRLDKGVSYDWFPRICARGNRLGLTWQAATYDWFIAGTVSGDRGETWEPLYQLSSGATDQVGYWPAVACGPNDQVVALYSEGPYWGYLLAHARRHNGTSWEPGTAIDPSPPPSTEQAFVLGAFAGPSRFVVAYSDSEQAAFAHTSTDGGISFGPAVRLDGPELNQAAFSQMPQVASDGSGNVWVSWNEFSPGEPAVAMRYSDDGGDTWSDMLRLNRDQPQGGLETINYPYAADDYSAALPGRGVFVFGGQRGTMTYSALVNDHSIAVDADGDGIPASEDCDDGDNGLYHAPGEVTHLNVTKSGETATCSWDSMADTAGPSTTYDMVSGLVSALRADGGFGGASCLADDLAAPSYDDTRSGPDPADAYYYLSRGQNGCGTGTWGDATIDPDPRDDLDASGPCP